MASTNTQPPAKPLRAGILGATGTVGQRFIELLAPHPWFSISVLGASSRSAGQAYKDAVHWKLSSSRVPAAVASLQVVECRPEFFIDTCDVIFSALDSSVAGHVEDAFARAGARVFSNAKNHRMDPLVPILVPHANPEHVDLIAVQREHQRFGDAGGYVVTNANCSSTGLAVVLAPLHAAFGLKRLLVVTLQAISGAGYPGVASLDIVDNVVPYIGGEEDKLRTEPQKILGTPRPTVESPEQQAIEFADFKVSAHCNRVNVIDGHTECVSVEFTKEDVTPQQVIDVLTAYRAPAGVDKLGLPSFPEQPIVVLDEQDRPQPRMDRDLGGGFVVTVGRVRECEVFDVKFTICSHNTIIGAAGGSVQNAELAFAKGYL